MDAPASKPEEQNDLAVLIGAGADACTLATYLDGLAPSARQREVLDLPGALLPLLYARCQTASPLTLDDLMPASVAPGQTVRFAGANNLPLFRHFEKRFARTKDGRVIGYNFQRFSMFTGPGYFTVSPAGAELLFDYTAVPTSQNVPSAWPQVRANHTGLSYFIYRNLHDFCRRVAADVIIGHATRLGKNLPQYFALTRTSV